MKNRHIYLTVKLMLNPVDWFQYWGIEVSNITSVFAIRFLFLIIAVEQWKNIDLETHSNENKE